MGQISSRLFPVCNVILAKPTSKITTVFAYYAARKCCLARGAGILPSRDADCAKLVPGVEDSDSLGAAISTSRIET